MRYVIPAFDNVDYLNDEKTATDTPSIKVRTECTEPKYVAFIIIPPYVPTNEVPKTLEKLGWQIHPSQGLVTPSKMHLTQCNGPYNIYGQRVRTGA
ncbi:MAG: hypothetical protein COU90_04605 [Candidatus Ryanbacteria bacterium CG10_big_fil_rev_8_21_14_0_10_43_42]|uniref:Uncharacterized protein n=1 Tax=Candidatus Ryanbacteria bacterium CG10_big_fil_rev_8_21_14_0_10_43_42 TaxID=1974864 RepID=A0A2M8KW40_9BACT|nr:MAG: hypothetical protein COU90_04605 [Candidatus Ryanbacteria bacterium CG10_big_fil_rev_8_21_14_0_10_43_42]